MLTFLYQYVRKNTNAVSLFVLAVLIGGCLIGFDFREQALGKVPDKYIFVTATIINDFLKQPNNPSGRYLYAATQATLDVVFPIVYCTLFGIIIAQLFSQKTAMRLLMLPLLVFILDLTENAVLIYLALDYEKLKPLTNPWLAVALTRTKWLFIATTLVTIVAGIACLFTSRKNQTA